MYVRMCGVALAIRESFICELLYFIQFAKVSTCESFRLYGISVHLKSLCPEGASNGKTTLNSYKIGMCSNSTNADSCHCGTCVYKDTSLIPRPSQRVCSVAHAVEHFKAYLHIPFRIFTHITFTADIYMSVYGKCTKNAQ